MAGILISEDLLRLFPIIEQRRATAWVRCVETAIKRLDAEFTEFKPTDEADAPPLMCPPQFIGRAEGDDE